MSEASSVIDAGMEAGWISPIIGKEIPLEEATRAHKEIIESKGTQGKMILTI